MTDAKSGAPPSSVWFPDEDRAAVLDFWRIYDAHYDAISAEVCVTVGSSRELASFYDSLEVGGFAALRAEARDDVREGVHGDWGRYEARLRRLATLYAARGFSFAEWYVISHALADAVAPRLVVAYGASPPRLIAVLRAMQRFLDRMMTLLGTEYTAAREEASRASEAGKTARLETALAALARSERQLHALAARLLRVREDERTRIAREIHDELGQQLTGLKMDVVWVARRTEAPEAVGRLLAMSALIDGAIEAVRRLATDLRPGVLDDLGLAAAIEWQAREFGRRAGIPVEVTAEADAQPLSADVATGLFRVFQEILTNVARHAGATRVRVRLDVADDAVALDVWDDGRGITAAEVNRPTSLGLLGMRERIALLGGSLDIDGAPGEGTTVRARTPRLAVAEVPP